MKHSHLQTRLSFGTCIVAVITRDEVIIGADSHKRYGDGSFTTVDKINKVRNMVFATTGFYGADDSDESLRISVPEIVGASIDCNISIGENLDQRIRSALETRLGLHLTRISKSEQEEFLAGLKEHGINVVVAGIENDSPTMSSRRFTLKPQLNKLAFDISPKDFHKDFQATGLVAPERYMAGAFEAILQSERLRPRPVTGDVSYVRDSIEIEIEFWKRRERELKNRWVAGPIRIVRVTKAGIIDVQ